MTAVVSRGVVRKGKVVDKTKKEKIFLYIVISKKRLFARLKCENLLLLLLQFFWR